jgi:SnoaL-like protein
MGRHRIRLLGAWFVTRATKDRDTSMRRHRIRFLPRVFSWKGYSPFSTESKPVTITSVQRGPGAFSHFWLVVASKKGADMSNQTTKHHCPENCFQGSTEFYDTPKTDRFTPSYLEARPLVTNVGTPWDERRNIFPPWIVEGSQKSPSEQYVEWFNGIWHTGDPSSWNRDVFTNTAVTIDPSGVTRGADEAAANFRLLFQFFPELRGEVVSWAANDREIFINWRFRIRNKSERLPIGPITQFLHDQQADRDFLVPVTDKFCFVEGRVSVRLATFDIITLIGYLSDNYGADELYDFLIAYFWQSTFSGGVAFLPRMLVNLFLGLFVWQPLQPVSLYAEASDGVVRLRWEPVKDAVAYRITRATALAGNYVSPRLDGKDVVLYKPPLTYDDWDVTNETPYWYLVSPIYEKWKPVPVCKSKPNEPITSDR